MKTALPPIEVVRTEGVRLHLADGRTLIDGIASWWTACHGYNHPAIVKAIQDQANQMPHVMMGGIVHPQAIKLADSLSNSKTAFSENPNRVFLCDSGSVAVEVALKMAVQFWLNHASRDPSLPNTKNRFVCFKDSYHGDTAGAMSVCDPTDGMHSHFKGFLLEQYPRPIPQTSDEFEAFDAFLTEKKDTLAGVIIEPLVQMAAGMRFHSPQTLTQIYYSTCKRHDLLFIVDEVATGFGRTGSMFAYQQATDVCPHILCVGKGLTGASVGMAATIADHRVYSAFDSDNWEDCLMHGPTFMGNPIACAAANASIELFENEPRLEQVANIESILRRELQPLADHANVIAVNCLGALGAVRLNRSIDVSKAIEYFISKKVWIRPINDTVYIAPAFTIGKPELLSLCEAVKDFLALNP